MHIIYLFFSIILAVLAQVLFKSFVLSKLNFENFFLSLLNIKLIFGFTLYLVSAIFYIIALQKIDLSVAYPTISISYIFLVLLSYILFGETLSLYKILGCILIMLGVSLIWK